MSEGQLDDTLLAYKAFERAGDERANFCRICWGPLSLCPGHQGYLEWFGPPPSPEELEAHRKDREIRARGLERHQAALEAAARKLGYDSLDDLMERTQP